MTKFIHKKLGWIAEKYSEKYIIPTDKWDIFLVKELIENSTDREPIQEKERTRDWLWIGEWLPNTGSKLTVGYYLKDDKSHYDFSKKIDAFMDIKKRQALNDDFEPDWTDEYQKKHFVFYDHQNCRLTYDYDVIGQDKDIYFSSAEKAKQFIDECWQHFLDYYNIK